MTKPRNGWCLSPAEREIRSLQFIERFNMSLLEESNSSKFKDKFDNGVFPHLIIRGTQEALRKDEVNYQVMMDQIDPVNVPEEACKFLIKDMVQKAIMMSLNENIKEAVDDIVEKMKDRLQKNTLDKPGTRLMYTTKNVDIRMEYYFDKDTDEKCIKSFNP